MERPNALIISLSFRLPVMSSAGSPAGGPMEVPPDIQETVVQPGNPTAAPQTPSPSPPSSPKSNTNEVVKTEDKVEESPAVVKTIHCFLCGGVQVCT